MGAAPAGAAASLELGTAPAVTDRALGCVAGRPRRSQVLGLILLMSRTASVKDVELLVQRDEVAAGAAGPARGAS